MEVTLGTDFIRLDEPCYGLFELNFQSPGSRGFHRYQIIQVIRNDRIAEFRKDLGASKKFKGIDQFRIPGGFKSNGTVHIVHKVGELIDIANEMRHRRSLFDKMELVGVNKIKE